jgi:hypothetical protein
MLGARLVRAAPIDLGPIEAGARLETHGAMPRILALTVTSSSTASKGVASILPRSLRVASGSPAT